MGARSNGCLICKSRRVRCDETCPICTRCVKAGIECKGYGPRHLFVDENIRIERSLHVTRLQQNELSSHEASLRPLYHTSGIRALVPREMPLTAFSTQICTAFFVDKIFSGRAHYHVSSREATCLPSTWWIYEATKQSPKAVQALAFIFFGKANKESSVCRMGMELYGESIVGLRGDLRDGRNGVGRNGVGFRVLACMTALCMYEMFTLRTGAGWRIHLDALSRLIEMRGPEQYKHFPEKSMFLEHRSILLLKAIVFRERTFLSRPGWKIIPWEDDPSSKVPAEYLIDILCDIAGLLVDMAYWPPATASKYHDFKERTKSLLKQLNYWWRDWSKTHPQACRTFVPDPETTITKDSEGLIFPTLLQYDSIWTAHTICLYDTARILLLYSWNKLAPHLDNNDEQLTLNEPNNTPLLGITSSLTALAHEIIRTSEYCHEPSHRFVGTFCVVLSQDAAYACLCPASREARFLARQGARFFGGVLNGGVQVMETENSCGLPGMLTDASSSCRNRCYGGGGVFWCCSCKYPVLGIALKYLHT